MCVPWTYMKGNTITLYIIIVMFYYFVLSKSTGVETVTDKLQSKLTVTRII